MTPPADPAGDKTHRGPGAIIRHGVWRSDRFPLSARAGHERWRERGRYGTQAAIRHWCRTCGPAAAHRRRRRRAQPGDTGPGAEVWVTSQGARHDWWRAVAPDDHGLALLGPRRCAISR